MCNRSAGGTVAQCYFQVCKTYYNGFERLRKDGKYSGKWPRNCLTNLWAAIIMSLCFGQNGHNNIRKDVLLWKADLRPDYAAITEKKNRPMRDGSSADSLSLSGQRKEITA